MKVSGFVLHPDDTNGPRIQLTQKYQNCHIGGDFQDRVIKICMLLNVEL